MCHILIILLSLVLPQCQTEDSSNCYWDATHNGNGLGHSFVDLNGEVYYL